MEAKIRSAFAGAQVDLVPGGKGDFTVTADGTQLWDKHETGSFPDDDAIVQALRDLARRGVGSSGTASPDGD